MEGQRVVVLGLVTIHCNPVLPHHVSLSSPRVCNVITHCFHLITSPGHVVIFVLCNCHQLVVIPSCVSTRWVGRKVGWGVLT